MSDTPYIGLREAAERLGVRSYQIAYAHTAGFVPEPPRFLGNRAYDEAALERLRAYFAARADRLAPRPSLVGDNDHI